MLKTSGTAKPLILIKKTHILCASPDKNQLFDHDNIWYPTDDCLNLNQYMISIRDCLEWIEGKYTIWEYDKMGAAFGSLWTCFSILWLQCVKLIQYLTVNFLSSIYLKLSNYVYIVRKKYLSLATKSFDS